MRTSHTYTSGATVAKAEADAVEAGTETEAGAGIEAGAETETETETETDAGVLAGAGHAATKTGIRNVMARNGETARHHRRTDRQAVLAASPHLQTKTAMATEGGILSYLVRVLHPGSCPQGGKTTQTIFIISPTFMTTLPGYTQGGTPR